MSDYMLEDWITNVLSRMLMADHAKDKMGNRVKRLGKG